MIAQELKQHPLAYSILLLSSIAFLVLFFMAWPVRSTERLLIVGYTGWYFLWGVITHRSKKMINPDIIKEYGFVALLGAALLLMLTF